MINVIKYPTMLQLQYSKYICNGHCTVLDRIVAILIKQSLLSYMDIATTSRKVHLNFFFFFFFFFFFVIVLLGTGYLLSYLQPARCGIAKCC